MLEQIHWLGHDPFRRDGPQIACLDPYRLGQGHPKSEPIPEMAGLARIDLAFLPVSGGPVMAVDEAVEAASRIHPRVAIPMHVGSAPESMENATAFSERAPVEVVLLERE
jgi:L-ascorbate metabolism protein UlaG (beta-lactamase superfamily)